MNFYETEMSEWKQYDVSEIDFETKRDYKTQCPACAEEGTDRSRNNLHVYKERGGCFCFKCAFAIPSEEQILEDQEFPRDDNLRERKRKVSNSVIDEKKLSKEELEEIVSKTFQDPKGWRGLEYKYIKGLGIRFVNDKDGNPCEMLTSLTYTQGGKTFIVGLKSRKFPKDFSHPRGYTGGLCDLIGYSQFKNKTKTLVIVEGEVDYASAYQMYQMDMERKNKNYELPAVVSTTNGVKTLLKSLTENEANFEFFKQFERVILALDHDDAGKKEIDEFIEKMPRATLYKANMRLKDANEYLKKGKISEWVNDTYWNVTPCTVAKIAGSGDWLDKAREELNTPRLKLPEFMDEVNKATRGGLPMGRYVIFAGASSIGKTIFVNSMIYDWIIKDTHKVGVVSLELSQGQYYIEMLSRHMGINIDDIDDNEERATILDNEDIIEIGNNFFRREDGSDRFHVVDDRDSDIKKIQELCEDLVVKHGVQVLVLDPISDLTQRLDNQQQVIFNSWIKSFIKKHNVLMIGINHVKKGDKDYDKGDIPDEGDLIGSYSGASSAAAVFFFSRNKMSSDEVERNTTLITTPKIRWTGRTGIVGKVFFDHKTRRLTTLDAYFGKKPETQPECLKPEKKEENKDNLSW